MGRRSELSRILGNWRNKSEVDDDPEFEFIRKTRSRAVEHSSDASESSGDEMDEESGEQDSRDRSQHRGTRSSSSASSKAKQGSDEYDDEEEDDYKPHSRQYKTKKASSTPSKIPSSFSETHDISLQQNAPNNATASTDPAFTPKRGPGRPRKNFPPPTTSKPTPTSSVAHNGADTQDLHVKRPHKKSQSTQPALLTKSSSPSASSPKASNGSHNSPAKRAWRKTYHDFSDEDSSVDYSDQEVMQVDQSVSGAETSNSQESDTQTQNQHQYESQTPAITSKFVQEKWKDYIDKAANKKDRGRLIVALIAFEAACQQINFPPEKVKHYKNLRHLHWRHRVHLEAYGIVPAQTTIPKPRYSTQSAQSTTLPTTNKMDTDNSKSTPVKKREDDDSDYTDEDNHGNSHSFEDEDEEEATRNIKLAVDPDSTEEEKTDYNPEFSSTSNPDASSDSPGKQNIQTPPKPKKLHWRTIRKLEYEARARATQEKRRQKLEAEQKAKATAAPTISSVTSPRKTLWMKPGEEPPTTAMDLDDFSDSELAQEDDIDHSEDLEESGEYFSEDDDQDETTGTTRKYKRTSSRTGQSLATRGLRNGRKKALVRSREKVGRSQQSGPVSGATRSTSKSSAPRTPSKSRSAQSPRGELNSTSSSNTIERASTELLPTFASEQIPNGEISEHSTPNHSSLSIVPASQLSIASDGGFHLQLRRREPSAVSELMHARATVSNLIPEALPRDKRQRSNFYIDDDGSEPEAKARTAKKPRGASSKSAAAKKVDLPKPVHVAHPTTTSHHVVPPYQPRSTLEDGAAVARRTPILTGPPRPLFRNFESAGPRPHTSIRREGFAWVMNALEMSLPQNMQNPLELDSQWASAPWIDVLTPHLLVEPFDHPTAGYGIKIGPLCEGTEVDVRFVQRVSAIYVSVVFPDHDYPYVFPNHLVKYLQKKPTDVHLRVRVPANVHWDEATALTCGDFKLIRMQKSDSEMAE